MKYLLDTNMCIYAQKKNPNVLAKMHENKNSGLAISVITLAELEYGINASMNPERNTIALLRFLAAVDVISFDGKAAAEYGKIRADLRIKGTPIGTMDMLIAAHAKSENLVVITHNVREFKRVDGLLLEDWFE